MQWCSGAVVQWCSGAEQGSRAAGRGGASSSRVSAPDLRPSAFCRCGVGRASKAPIPYLSNPCRQGRRAGGHVGRQGPRQVGEWMTRGAPTGLRQFHCCSSGSGALACRLNALPGSAAQCTHWDGDAPVVVDHGGADKDVGDGGASRAEAAGGACRRAGSAGSRRLMLDVR